MQQYGGVPTLLIVDQMSAHLVTYVLLELVLKGYISCLQVCDIGLNKPFKDHMRNTVNKWLVDNSSTVETLPFVTNYFSVDCPCVVVYYRKHSVEYIGLSRIH